MSKYTPTKLTQLTANESAAVDAINKNLDDIKEYIDDSISRSAKTPSQLLADLDMNGHKILNLAAATNDTDVVRQKDVVDSKAEIKRMHDEVMTTGERILTAAEVTDEKVQEASDAAALSEAWATKMDGPVSGTSYSSKYYAQQVESISSEIETVSGIASDVTAVAANETNINAVNANKTNIDAVAGNETNINAVNSNKTNIDTVATNVSDVGTVAGSIANVNTVASSDTNIGTVATNMSDVNDCATNMAAIQDAPNQAQAAADSAALAYQYGNDKINQTHITNCITYIPQDIKLELDDGTLTLKAGSKVYIPNGFEEDGTTPKYTIATNDSDIVAGTSGSTTDAQMCMVCTTSGTSITGITWQTRQESGTSSTSSQTYTIYYNTSINKLGYAGSSTTVDFTYNCSFPITLCTCIANNGGWKSIDQIFNGFGYIGSTVFALPGVKALKPDGRNTDGTLKSIEFETNSVITFTAGNYTLPVTICFSTSAMFTNGAYSYNEKENFNYNGSERGSYCAAAECNLVGGKISNWYPKSVFHALDYNDKGTIAGWSMPSNRYTDLTLGASGSSYTAPANGWFYIAKTAGTASAYITATATNGYEVALCSPNTTFNMKFIIPVNKGDSVSFAYNATGSTNAFKFFYSRGEV